MFGRKRLSPEVRRAMIQAEFNRPMPEEEVILPKIELSDPMPELVLDESEFLKDFNQSKEVKKPEPLSFLEQHTRLAEKDLEVAELEIKETQEELERYKKESDEYIKALETKLREAVCVREAIKAKQSVLISREESNVSEPTQPID